jgi:transcriptional regulator with XRE-family HTH domain
MNALGNKIKEIRKEKGMTQEELAERSGINLRTVQRIENGETTPRGNSLHAISNVLNIELSSLISKHENENKVAKIILEVIFLIALNISLMSLFGFLTFDTGANWNSRLAAILLSIFIPLVIIFFTQDMNRLVRIAKFGTGLIIYMVWSMILHTFPEPRAIMYGLVPSIIIYLAVLYYGKTLFSRT